MNATVHAVCDECGGEGQRYVDDFDHHGEHYTRQVDCENCQGTGDVIIEDDELLPLNDLVDAALDAEPES